MIYIYQIYRKIPLIRPGRIYEQSANLIGLYSVGALYIRDVNWVTYLVGLYFGGAYIRGRINEILRYTYIFLGQNSFFLKHVVLIFSLIRTGLFFQSLKILSDFCLGNIKLEKRKAYKKTLVKN